MQEERYNNRQIEKMLGDQVADLKEHITLHIDPLTKQVTMTNGTVKWLTKMTYLATGALIVLWPIMAWFVRDYLVFKEHFSDSVSAAVMKTLDNYEIKIVE